MNAPLIACHECDLLQREIPLRARGVARCARCGATLYRSHPRGLDHALAFATGGLVLFVLANAFPVVGLRVQGELIQTTLFGAVEALSADGVNVVAAVVFLTIIAAPLVQIVAMLNVLLPLRFGRLPPRGAITFRTLRTVQPWGMAEVLMLGILVALVKLAHIAEVVPGVGLWSLGALVVVLAAAAAVFDPRELWAKLDAPR